MHKKNRCQALLPFRLLNPFSPHKGGRPHCHAGLQWLQVHITVLSKPLKSAQIPKLPTGIIIFF